MRSAKSKLNHDSMNKLFKITNITGRESMNNYPCSDKWWKLNHDDMSELFRITNITGRGSMKNFPAQMNDEINMINCAKCKWDGVYEILPRVL